MRGTQSEAGAPAYGLSLRETVLVSFAGLMGIFVNAGWVVAVSFAPVTCARSAWALQMRLQ